jgi:hypothetical protein
MNKSNKKLTKQKAELIEQIRITLRKNNYSIRTEEVICKDIYMSIMNHDCYFISTKPMLAILETNRRTICLTFSPSIKQVYF